MTKREAARRYIKRLVQQRALAKRKGQGAAAAVTKKKLETARELMRP